MNECSEMQGRVSMRRGLVMFWIERVVNRAERHKEAGKTVKEMNRIREEGRGERGQLPRGERTTTNHHTRREHTNNTIPLLLPPQQCSGSNWPLQSSPPSSPLNPLLPLPLSLMSSMTSLASLFARYTSITFHFISLYTFHFISTCFIPLLYTYHLNRDY